jgi:hypothetical protein
VRTVDESRNAKQLVGQDDVQQYLTDVFSYLREFDVVDVVVPSLAIPRNWLVDAKGKLEWEQIGFIADSGQPRGTG